MSSEHENLSPVIDLDKSSIDSLHIEWTTLQVLQMYILLRVLLKYEPAEGDSLEVIYLTRQVQLKTILINQLNVKLDGFVRHSRIEILM